MPRVNLLTIRGTKSGTVTLPKEIFAVKVNPQLMAQAVRVYLANQRKAKAKTKTRGEVRGSRRKIWRQKGTGRARHGDLYAPIFVGGGRAHGPRGVENYQLKMSKKMKRAALFSALTSKLKDKEIFVVKDLEKIEPKTKKMAQILQKKLKIEGKVLIILPEVLDNVMRAARNIRGVSLAQASLLNTYQVLNGGKLLLMKESIDRLKETFLRKPSQRAK